MENKTEERLWMELKEEKEGAYEEEKKCQN